MLFILNLNQPKVKKLKTIRIYINEKIQEGNLLMNQESSHYLKNVMRLKLGDAFNVFNHHYSKVKNLKEDTEGNPLSG